MCGTVFGAVCQQKEIWTSTWNDILGGYVWPKETEMGKMLKKRV